MELGLIFSLFLGLYSLLKFGIIPSNHSTLRFDTPVQSIATRARIAFFSSLTSTLFIGTISSGILYIAFFFLLKQDGNSPESVQTVIDLLKDVGSTIGSFQLWWSATALLFLIFGLALYSKHREKNNQESRINEALNNIIDELNENGLSEEDFQSDTEETLLIKREIEKILKLREQLLKEVASSSSDETENQLIEADEYLAELNKLLVRTYENQKVISMIDKSLVDFAPPKTKWEKTTTIFISKGFVGTINKGTQLITLLSMLFIIPCLLGISSAASQKNIQNRIVTLDALIVKLESDSIEKDLESQLGKLPKKATSNISKTDAHLIDTFAEVVESTILSDALPQAERAIRATYRLHSSLVRDRILAQTVQKASNPLLEKLPSFKTASELDTHGKEFVELIDDSLAKKGVRTAQGRSFRDQITFVAKRKGPSFIVDLRSAIASFQTPASPGTINKAIIANVLDRINAGSGPVHSMFSGAVNDSMLASVEQAQRVTQNKILSDILGGTSAREALLESKNITRGVPKAQFKNAINSLHSTPERIIKRSNLSAVINSHPTRYATKSADYVRTKDIAVTVDRLATKVQALNSHLTLQQFDSIARFGDWFPGQKIEAVNTPRMKMMSRYANKGILNTTTKQLTHGINTSLRRAGSYKMLRGFSRIGGVLIGKQAQTSASPLNIVDFDWAIEKGNISFQLQSAEGKKHILPPMKASIAHSALMYATDGRPVAVTMTTANPMECLKILLHPTLEDTALGYRLIELDRLVDAVSSSNESLQQSRYDEYLTVERQVALYNYCWALSYIEAAKIIDDNELDPYLEKVAHATVEGLKLTIDKIYDQIIGTIAPDSILIQKDEYFSTRVTSCITSARTKGITLHQLPNHIASQIKEDFAKDYAGFKGDFDDIANDYLLTELQALGHSDRLTVESELGLNNTDYSEKTTEVLTKTFRETLEHSPVKDLETLRVEIEPWSGVREKPYAASIGSYTPNATQIDNFPLTFLVQIAFTTPSFFDSSKSQKGRTDRYEYRMTTPPNSESDAEEEPWILEKLNAPLMRGIVEYIKKNEKNKWDQIINDSIEFICLQRFFNNSFSGQLGHSFPIYKLEALMSDLSKHQAPKYQTAKWNSCQIERYIDNYISALFIVSLQLTLEEKTNAVKVVKPYLRELNSHLNQLTAINKTIKEYSETNTNNPQAARTKKWTSLWERKIKVLRSLYNYMARNKKHSSAYSSLEQAIDLEAIAEIETAIMLSIAHGTTHAEKISFEERFNLTTIPPTL